MPAARGDRRSAARRARGAAQEERLNETEKLRLAGTIAGAAREFGRRLIVSGARLRDVCGAVEDEIERRGGRLAFPAQTSRNQIAAHYCPAPDEDTVYEAGDLAKLDLGVHVDGYVVDTALTVAVDEVRSSPLIEATRAALDAAVERVRPGVPVSELSAAIEQAIVARGARPVRNIGGHGVGRWLVHCAPAVPNVPEAGPDRLQAGMTIAIEPFATDGAGLVSERGRAEVFRHDPQHAARDGVAAELMRAIREFRGLPFARRQLRAFAAAEVEEALKVLAGAGALRAYQPLVEVSGRLVAQTEHTLLVTDAGAEVLTA